MPRSRLVGRYLASTIRRRRVRDLKAWQDGVGQGAAGGLQSEEFRDWGREGGEPRDTAKQRFRTSARLRRSLFGSGALAGDFLLHHSISAAMIGAHCPGTLGRRFKRHAQSVSKILSMAIRFLLRADLCIDFGSPFLVSFNDKRRLLVDM